MINSRKAVLAMSLSAAIARMPVHISKEDIAEEVIVDQDGPQSEPEPQPLTRQQRRYRERQAAKESNRRTFKNHKGVYC